MLACLRNVAVCVEHAKLNNRAAVRAHSRRGIPDASSIVSGPVRYVDSDSHSEALTGLPAIGQIMNIAWISRMGVFMGGLCTAQGESMLRWTVHTSDVCKQPSSNTFRTLASPYGTWRVGYSSSSPCVLTFAVDDRDTLFWDSLALVTAARQGREP